MSEVKNVSCEEFESLMSEEGSFVVKAPIEYSGMIEGTDLVIPLNCDLDDCRDRLPEDKDVKLLVYCLRGLASRYISEHFLGLSYNKVYNLEGGMVAWKESGREVKG